MITFTDELMLKSLKASVPSMLAYIKDKPEDIAKRTQDALMYRIKEYEAKINAASK